MLGQTDWVRLGRLKLNELIALMCHAAATSTCTKSPTYITGCDVLGDQ